MKPVPPNKPRIGLALAGGGPLGAIYEIGALCALAEALPGVDFTALDGYVGVSAGSFIAAGLANGMSPRQLCTSFVENHGPRNDRIHPGLFFRPALGEYAQRLATVPRLLLQAAYGVAVQRRSLLAAAEGLGRALPTGLFSSAALQRQLAQVFSEPGRTNNFRQLKRRLVLVATDLDSGEAAPFGLPGWDHVPISQAVAASAALPGLFPPEAINGRWYVDGALKKTLHARVLLDLGLDLVLCLNPLVPFNAGAGGALPHRVLGASERIPRLVDGGLPVVLSQTFRSLIHSRLEVGMKGYEASHPGTDMLLFEPDHRDPEMFLANTFGYAQRRLLAEHAYQHTRADLRSRRSALRTTLALHGLVLDEAVLDDTQRHLLAGRQRHLLAGRQRHLLAGRQRQPAGPASRAGQALQRLDEVLNDLEQAVAARQPGRPA